ncbi:hypothetical protein WA026_008886 [Henosepilachna vigintioctopunctata]|uniref:Uncharacterized protein n=1 Tax=Henosepilachna vigintioctopunctata TaxID=420089 RepID=A0AAW1VCH7_9CUCU
MGISRRILTSTTLFLFCFGPSCLCSNNPVETIWNLTSYALQSRQIHPSPQSKLFQPYLLKGEYMSQSYHNPYLSELPEVSRDVPSVHGLNHHSITRFSLPHFNQHIPNVMNSNYGPYYTNSKYPYYPIVSGHPDYNKYGSLRPQIGYPQRFEPLRPNVGYPQRQPGLFSLLPSRQSFMEALDSIARNDELNCVPRILCEVTSGTLSAGRQSGFRLPFNINMESFAGLLSGLNGVDANPLISFGKAALLGYSSKGNAATCMYAYPQCPRDPDKLVEYLNNYNGGFFRFFGGFNSQNQQGGIGHFYGQHPIPHQRPPFDFSTTAEAASHGLYRPYRGYGYKVDRAEKRILTKPSDFDFTSNRFPDNRQQRGIKFPNDIDEYYNELNPPNNFHSSHGGDSLRTLRFPIRDEEDTREGPIRKPKRLSDFHYNDVGIFQRPLPNHRPTPMIFPDRTGTGELKFTPDELSENYGRPFALQNNNPISFNWEPYNDAFYHINSGSNALRPDTLGLDRQNNRFFPY